ncbi:aminopeptidase N [Corynebacterium aquilae]|uniref:Aminopeptidase N n=1 Tax=Corynebacterium aquilae DSM 44791 TaxID=1431546 RepID=A0A1L7CHD6_9CORY|nr:aminopeptidase N [Corynebacterium aquilae]APT85271.1 aminopeptidase N [Corynebacterium aquilae DSM 44791]
MTSLNLTREEAQTRADLVSDCHYDIALDLTEQGETFVSDTTVRFTTTKAGSTFIDLRADKIREAVLDGQRLDNPDPQQGIVLSNMEPGEHTLQVIADCVYSRTGQGLHRFIDPADNETYLYTQFETADAKRVFTCFDQPDIKATYTMKVTTPQGWKVISNPALEVNHTENGDIHTGAVDYKLSTYLVAFCAGPYHEVTDSWTGALTHHPETPATEPTELTVPFGIYCRKSLAHALDHETLFEQTKQGFDFYHANFGMAYPFGKYDQVFCPEYNMGAMENAGCVTFRDEYVFISKVARTLYERRCDTVLHELAHMWFGDLVTMRWWGDLWLNESFATWSAAISQAEATEFDTAWVTFANVEKAWAYQQDQLPSTHPIVADAGDIETVEQNFDGITYAKGASVFKQLQAYVGREPFFAGVRKHFANHAFSNATFEDLLGALAEASGRDLSDWANQWLTTTGVNTLSPDFEVTDGKYTRFAVAQSGAQPGQGETRTHRIQVGLYNLVDGEVKRTFAHALDIEGASTEVPEIVGQQAADLVIVNDEDLTYALMKLDEVSLSFALENMDKISDPMARALIWSTAWEMVRDGELKARDYLRLVALGAPKETEVFVLESVLNKAALALGSYADPTWRDNTGAIAHASMVLEAAKAAPAGSDYQLVFTQALSNLVFGDDAAQLMRSILADAPELEGLHVDADLRWRALTSLIARGDYTPEEALAAIEEEKTRDKSSNGRNWAWTAEAAINTANNKAAIFEAITAHGKDMSNLELRHKGRGLTWAGSDKNLTDLSARYFSVAPTVWDTFESEVALRTLTEIYPSWDISEEGIARAEELLAGEHTAGFKRVIAEGADRVKRALRNRTIDAR